MDFYKKLSQYYDIIFPAGKLQLEFIKKYSSNRKTILDIAAGTGNYAMAFSKMGYKVDVLELDKEMIKILNDKNKKENTNVKSIEMDMRSIDQLGKEKYEVIYCIGNSLVHLSDLEEINNFVKKAYNALTDNGVFITQVVNYDRILGKDIKNLPTIDKPDNGVKFVRKYNQKNGRIMFTGELLINEDSNIEKYNSTVSLYPLLTKDLDKILKNSGFREWNFYGGFDEREYTIDSMATIVVAYK